MKHQVSLKEWPPVPGRLRDGDRRLTDILSYVLVFRVVPIDKVGEPDEKACTVERNIEVRLSIGDITWIENDHSGVPQAPERMVFWFGRKALEGKENITDGFVKLNLDSPNARIDLARVAPEQPFELELPNPDMGFHTLSQKNGAVR